MNAYLDHLLDLVEPDGSYHFETKGYSATGLPDVEIAGQLALLVELRAIRELLEHSFGAADHDGRQGYGRP